MNGQVWTRNEHGEIVIASVYHPSPDGSGNLDLCVPMITNEPVTDSKGSSGPSGRQLVLILREKQRHGIEWCELSEDPNTLPTPSIPIIETPVGDPGSAETGGGNQG